jgi:hypothetical protein
VIRNIPVPTRKILALGAALIALLHLFDHRPGELRFVVGREPGHIKCGHAELERKGYARPWYSYATGISLQATGPLWWTPRGQASAARITRPRTSVNRWSRPPWK